DVVLFKSGSKLPADVRFLELTADAAFDRSVLTGEVVPLRGSIHSTDDNYLETACIGLAGTHCTCGSGLGIILDTGKLPNKSFPWTLLISFKATVLSSAI